ncbi:hypothetical protein PInf_017254 [Phytophthora infestans]|nr:hypothetical protein PInf_017254 [Phytophthora infestans]
MNDENVRALAALQMSGDQSEHVRLRGMVTCPHCYQGFGRASLPIHMRRCRSVLPPTEEEMAAAEQDKTTRRVQVPSLVDLCLRFVTKHFESVCMDRIVAFPEAEAALIGSMPSSLVHRMVVNLVKDSKRRALYMLAGKRIVICGFGDVGKGSAQAMKAAGAIVYVTEVDPICALQACMEGFQVVRLETVVSEADIFITTTGNKDIIMAKDMLKMKNNAIVGNIGHFDNEIDMAGVTKIAKRQNIKPQVDRFIFEDGHAVIVLAQLESAREWAAISRAKMTEQKHVSDQLQREVYASKIALSSAEC